MSIEAGVSALSHWLAQVYWFEHGAPHPLDTDPVSRFFAAVGISADDSWRFLWSQLNALTADVQSYMQNISYVAAVPAGVEEIVYNDYQASYQELLAAARAYTLSMSRLQLEITNALPDGVGASERSALVRLQGEFETAQQQFLKAQADFEHYRQQVSPFRRV